MRFIERNRPGYSYLPGGAAPDLSKLTGFLERNHARSRLAHCFFKQRSFATTKTQAEIAEAPAVILSPRGTFDCDVNVKKYRQLPYGQIYSREQYGPHTSGYILKLPNGWRVSVVILAGMSNSLLIIRNQDPFYCGPFAGGEYDLSEASSVCGTGARRVSPIKLPSARLKNRVSITQKHEVVVPERVAEAIKRVAPHCLRQVLDQTTGDPTNPMN